MAVPSSLAPSVGRVRKRAHQKWDVVLLTWIQNGEDNLHIGVEADLLQLFPKFSCFKSQFVSAGSKALRAQNSWTAAIRIGETGSKFNPSLRWVIQQGQLQSKTFCRSA